METEAARRIGCEDAEYSEEAVVRLERHFAKLVEDDKIQCASYLLSRNGRVFAEGALGKLHYNATDERLQKDSIRRIASVTKLFTAVAIFQLVERGTIFLRQPVADWIEEFKHPMYEKITIMHLLTHTSGVQADPFYYLEPYPMGWWDIMFAFQPDTEGPDAIVEPDELEMQRQTAWIRALLSGKPLSQPGEKWNYSSAGYSVLGEVITRASSMPYEKYIIDNIATPLGMSRTFFEVPIELQTEVCVINEHESSRLEYNDRQYAPPRAGGGLYSTLADLFRFGQMLLSGGTLDGVRILSRKSVEKMTDNVLDKGVNGFSWGGRLTDMIYGLGPLLIGENEWIAEDTFGHEGAGRCKLLLDREHNAVILFFVPSNSDWCPESMIGTQNIIGSGWL